MLIHVVGLHQYREPPFALEVVHVAAGPVPDRTGPGHHPPKRAVAEFYLGHDVDGLGRVAVVEAREPALLAALVKHLHLVHHFGGQVFERRVGIGAIEGLAVDQHLRHVFTLGLHLAIGAAAHPGQLIEQVASGGVRVGFEGFGVELGRVALLHRLGRLARHHHTF